MTSIIGISKKSIIFAQYSESGKKPNNEYKKLYNKWL